MIHQLYQELLPVVPEYLAAINICLVKGWIRPATLVEPIIRGTVINFSQLEPVVHKYGLASRRWNNRALLVYQPELQYLVDELDPKQVAHEKFGQVLGYRCPGDLMARGIRHQIDLVVENPTSGQENPLIGYICARLTQDLLDDLINDAEEAAKFLRQHLIAPRLRLKIWHHKDGRRGNVVVDFDQWF